MTLQTGLSTERSRPSDTAERSKSPDRSEEQSGSDHTPPDGTASGEDGPDDDDTVDELPLDQVFEILKNSRRRETLRYLNENEGMATLSDVAEHIAALENDTTVRAISSTQRKRVYVGLYQCHLPKMDDAAIIDFDKNRGTIGRGPAASQLTPYLDDTDGQNWHKIYLGSIAGGTLLFALGRTVEMVYGLSATIVLLGLIVFLTGISVVHAKQDDELLS